jgi:hypothetical protein
MQLSYDYELETEMQFNGIKKSILRDFLKSFKDINTMVRGTIAHYGYVTFISHDIQTLCKTVSGGSSVRKEMKRLVLINLGRRQPQKITTLATLVDLGTKKAIDLPRDKTVS